MTLSATEQVGEIVSYISKVLLAPDTAKKWADYLQNEIMGLRSLPSRFALVANEPWRSKGIRKMPVKNFLVYYWINEVDLTVWVTAVIYARRDQLNALLSMPL